MANLPPDHKESRNSGKFINSLFKLFPAPAAGWLPNYLSEVEIS
jgi:hypothetical protein